MLGLGRHLADLHLPIRVNGDLAFFQAVNRRLIDAGAIDRAFVEEYCEGFEELRDTSQQARPRPGRRAAPG